MLPTDMFDTMVAPFNSDFGPPQAQNHYFYDGIVQTYPYKVETENALRHGTLTYWNPHVLGGYPQYAASLGNNFDPLNILLMWLSPIDALEIQSIIGLFIAGVGMLLLLRYLGVSAIIGMLISASYSLNTLFVSTVMYRWTIATFCWVPYLVFMLLLFFDRNRKKYLLYASLFLGLSFLGGNFQISFFAALIAGFVMLFYPTSNQRFLVRLGALGIVGILSFLVTAFMWFPSLELFYWSAFKGGSIVAPSSQTAISVVQHILSLPLAIIYFFLPGIAGGAQSYSLKNLVGADVTDFNGAIGFLASLLGFSGCFILWKEKRLRPFIYLGIASLVLPTLTPLYSILYFRFFIVASFAFCVIGAVTFQTLITSKSLTNRFSPFLRIASYVVASLVLIVGILSSYLTFFHSSAESRVSAKIAPKLATTAFGSGNPSWAFGRISKTLDYFSFSSPQLWVPIFAAAIIVFLLRRFYQGKLSVRDLQIGIVIPVIIPLIMYARMWIPAINTDRFPITPTNPITTFLQSHTDGRFISWTASNEPKILPANSSTSYNINDMNGWESLTNPSIGNFYNRHVPSNSLNLRLLGICDVKYILTKSQALASAETVPVFSSNGVTIYKNLLCKPRAYFAKTGHRFNSDSDINRELLQPEFDGSVACFNISDAPTVLPTSNIDDSAISSFHSRSEEVTFTTNTTSKAIVILTDSYYPGWKCYNNGVQTPIYRVNNFMRAIIVPAGIQSIEFKFDPPIFKVGVVTSIFTALVEIVLLIISYRTPKKNQLAL